MVVARASGMDLASILRQNTFLTLGVRPTGGPRAGRGAREGPPDGGPQKGPRGFYAPHPPWGGARTEAKTPPKGCA